MHTTPASIAIAMVAAVFASSIMVASADNVSVHAPQGAAAPATTTTATSSPKTIEQTTTAATTTATALTPMLCHGQPDPPTCTSFGAELCTHPVLQTELQKACPSLCNSCEERRCHDTGEASECADLVPFCADPLIGHMVRKDCPRACGNCVTTTTTTASTTTATSSSTTTTTTSATSTTATTTTSVSSTTTISGTSTTTTGTTTTTATSTTTTATATSTTNTVTNTTHTETSTTASTTTGTTESSTSYTETSTTASTTTGTETSTSDTDTAARTTATSSSTTTTSTTATTRLSTTTATSTATESMVVGDVAAPGGEDGDHLPDQLEATTSFWAKAEMVAIMASILGVILVASIIIAVAAWRKSSAEIAGKKTTLYSTHHGNGNGNGNGLRKKPTGMVSMFALDAAAKQQTNLWHQASSFVNGRRRRSTSGSVGSVGSLTIPSWTSGRASVTSLPVFIGEENGVPQPEEMKVSVNIHPLNRLPPVASFPPISDAEILYAVAEEEEESEVEEEVDVDLQVGNNAQVFHGIRVYEDDADGAAAGAAGGDDDNSVCSDEYLDVLDVELPAVHVGIVGNNVAPTVVQIASAASNSVQLQSLQQNPQQQQHQQQEKDHPHDADNANALHHPSYVNVDTLRQLVGVHVDAYERQHIHPTSGNQNADVRAAAAAEIRAAAATEDRKGQRNQTESEYDCGSEVVVANMYFEILGEQPPAVVPTEPGTREHHRFTSL